MSGQSAQEVYDALLASKKYRHASEEVLMRTAEWAASRHGSPKAATKAAKRQLHQVYGAFFEKVDFALIESLLAPLTPETPAEELKQICTRILDSHVSTAERLPVLSEFYSTLFERTGKPRSVLDLACGLNPFALPWMGLKADASYRAYDMDRRLVRLLNRFFQGCGRPGSAFCGDLLSAPLPGGADLVLLMKALPTLERQGEDAGLELLGRLQARVVVVSFPVRTLGGKNVGMERHYGAFMQSLLRDLPAKVETLRIGGESLHILYYE